MADLAKLEKLANYLRDLPRKKQFTMNAWRTKRWRITVHGFKEMSCGYAGCAMGWAAMDALFEGLRLDVDNFHQPTLIYRKTRPFVIDKKQFEWQEWINFEAAAELFDISRELAEYFFQPTSYHEGNKTKPKHVADRIAGFIWSEREKERADEQYAKADAWIKDLQQHIDDGDVATLRITEYTTD